MTQIFLEDETFSHISNPLIGRAISIPKFTFDILQSCHVVLPNGALVEAYPENQLKDPYMSFAAAVSPFTSCSIGFVGAPDSYSGTYELYSVVEDWSSAQLSLTRKKFHITFIQSEVVFPTDGRQ